MATDKNKCRRCGAVKGGEIPFSRWTNLCKPCIKEYARRRWIEQREKLLADNRKWEKANPERRRALKRATYARHREKYLAKKRKNYDPEIAREVNRRQRLLHGDRWKAQDRLNYSLNPEKTRAEVRLWRSLHPKELKEIQHRYYKKHYFKFLDRNHRRKAQLQSNGIEPYSFDDIIKRDNDICHICKKKVPVSERSRDHLIPISRGGADAPWNVALAHLKCNIQRGADRLPAQLRLLG